MAQNAFDAGLHYSGRAVGDAQGIYAALSEKAIDSCVQTTCPRSLGPLT
jgi:hypothetical protein